MKIGFKKLDTGRTEIFDVENILTIRTGEDVLIQAIQNNDVYFGIEGKEDWDYNCHGGGNKLRGGLERFLYEMQEAIIWGKSVLIEFSEKEKKMDLSIY